MKKIQLTQGKSAIVDDNVYDHLIEFNWCAVKLTNIFYAFNSQVGLMHRYVYSICHGVDLEGKFIDHINRDALDNQIENLRVVTRAENSRNRSDRKKSANSTYVGVAWKEHAGRWRSQYWKDGKTLALGYFDTAEAAGMAHDRAVLYFEGDTGVLNFPDWRNSHDLSAWKSDTRQKLRKDNPTGYRGVYIKNNKFAASIAKNGHKEYLGTFVDAIDAAKAYDKRFIELFGFDSTYLNFPTGE